jgi:hypothetical protein
MVVDPGPKALNRVLFPMTTETSFFSSPTFQGWVLPRGAAWERYSSKKPLNVPQNSPFPSLHPLLYSHSGKSYPSVTGKISPVLFFCGMILTMDESKYEAQDK